MSNIAMSLPYIHPELQYLIDEAGPQLHLSQATLQQFRSNAVAAETQLHFPQATTPRCHRIERQEGEIEVFEFSPSHTPRTQAAMLWMHGGGYVKGHGKDEWFGALFAELAGVRIFSVDYRLAPEHPFPAAMDDCRDALNWLASNSDQFGVDPARIAIGGASAGAGLAAGLALANRDLKGPSVAFQLLLYPMLDHLHDNPAAYMDVPRWPRAVSMQAWDMYLGGEDACPYSVPATAKDLANLPAAFVCIGEADMFLDEVQSYAARLHQAGVDSQLCTYSGMFHSAETSGYSTSIGNEMSRDYVNALSIALRTERANYP